jgi:REP element-mobilizing transposase RayT
MARGRRIEFPGACYHVFSRGNEKRNIFKDKQDHYRFMRLLDEARKDHSLTIHAYVLMPNHYHLVVETADVLISKAMSDLLSRYSMYFNYKYERTGHWV